MTHSPAPSLSDVKTWDYRHTLDYKTAHHAANLAIIKSTKVEPDHPQYADSSQQFDDAEPPAKRVDIVLGDLEQEAKGFEVGATRDWDAIAHARGDGYSAGAHTSPADWKARTLPPITECPFDDTKPDLFMAWWAGAYQALGKL